MTVIINNPQIRFGKPHIKNSRIIIQNVMELIDAGLSFTEIQRDYYPELTTKQIKACIQPTNQLTN